MGDEAEDRYTLNIDCRQSKHRDTHTLSSRSAGVQQRFLEQ